MNPDESHKELFVQLVLTLAHSAWQHLGKTVNPATQKAEVNLDHARATIDLLEMLQAKCKGNLDDEESHFLQNTVGSLQLNFVEVANAEPAKPAPPTEPPPPATEPASESKVKYRKSFG